MISSQEEWPQEELDFQEELVNAEVSKSSYKRISKDTKRFVNDICVTNACANVTLMNNEDPWYLIRFSNYNKIVRMVAWMVRFMRNAKTTSDLRHRGELSASEFDYAEELLIKLTQQESFTGATDRRLRGLNVYSDDSGLIRSKTLISNRSDEFTFRYPVVMDPNHKFTRLLIENTHRRLNHAGINTTMRVLRERVWIISNRRAVRSVVNRCYDCRRYAAKTLETPPASPPVNRVRDAAVFEVTGVDYAGPLFLKNGQKAWVCLYTCGVYRAVHFELVTTLSTIGFIATLRRFIARRGRPSTIYSDNGTNFVGTDHLLQLVDWKRVKSYCSAVKIEWRFNPPTAAW